VAVALLGALLALALLFPGTKEMVVVVPSADGHVGMVVVERGDDRVILNEAYATSRVTSDGQIHLEKLEPKETEAQVHPGRDAGLGDHSGLPNRRSARRRLLHQPNVERPPGRQLFGRVVECVAVRPGSQRRSGA